jgi:hypothetical protein
MLRVREPRCSIYNSFLYPSVSSFVLWCSLANEFVRFLHRQRSPPYMLRVREPRCSIH